jgi:TM2 domain-containing membrane protein YozV
MTTKLLKGIPLSRRVAKNIGKSDRLLRAVIGAGLLLWAITTTWSPILIFFSGFAFFEAIFSWCGFYAAMGKNTCPVE